MEITSCTGLPFFQYGVSSTLKREGEKKKKKTRRGEKGGKGVVRKVDNIVFSSHTLVVKGNGGKGRRK